ncbi:Cobalt-zinc-cadmium resistance protein CzcA [Roseobacter fucihabitans]|uniref:Cobalt-zinc-cadmium resistance protein CzcA n=1 Tax=Roseobacter fucihabitans TaxID=1537242 RepID=A0ABZ2C0D3_9RHOB|nr:efflux RND transporter permease subunit [Roseobacter litoralis]MBC6964158.1 Cobalt-zinc-cadmium resistance protein CzcA [Roseobacter litoralis]
MTGIIDAAFSRSRVVILLFTAILAVGSYAYLAIAKESNPDIPIPFIYVSTTLDGISPQDSERLLVKPLEAELSGLADLREIRGNAAEGYASVTLEFDPGADVAMSLDQVRVGVDRARPDLPQAATDPVVTEINTALFPILTTVLSGPLPERKLNQLARDLREKLDAVSGILEVEISGGRSDLLEVLIDPMLFETYGLSFEDLIGQISRNNTMVAAGAIEGNAGRMVLKVPGLIEGAQDLMQLPIKVKGDTVVTFADVASVRRTFEDPDSFARINGHPALALDIKKRSGANIIATVAAAKAVVEKARADWPETVRVDYLLDESVQVETMLGDLEANVIAAIILVMIVIIYALGMRSALLVGLSIPGAFLAGVGMLWAMGFTMNIVVLFSLILVVGMLVDGAIVTTELADRHLQGGMRPTEAYAAAAKRMTWPLISSTATTLSVFFPLLFWKGMTGEFMKFLPITVILTLCASLLMALIFIPVLGGMIARRAPQTAAAKAVLYGAEQGDPRKSPGMSGLYARALHRVILHPAATVLTAVALLLGTFSLYGQLGSGVSFFPKVEPEFMQVQIRLRDNSSVFERDALVRHVEAGLLHQDEIASVYATTTQSSNDEADLIGTLQLELTAWNARRPAAVIAESIRSDLSDIPGILIQIETENDGPAGGKPVDVTIMARDLAAADQAVTQMRGIMDRIGGFSDVSDSRALPGVEWRIRVDRSKAARFGADIALVGQAIQLLTQGINVARFRPDDAQGTVDIRVRFPAQDRTLDALRALRVPTQVGVVSIANFVAFEPVPRSGSIQRIDQKRVLTLEANVTPGLLVDAQISKLRAAFEAAPLPEGVVWAFEGEAEEQEDAMMFLLAAFGAAITLMFGILIAQFNSFYQALVVMSAIVFSVAGVLLGLLVTGRPFGVVMGGIGVIALAGIVVNNNIVLIDTYNQLRHAGQTPLEAALRTGALRLRPVMLTSLTTVLGLMPMVIGMNINFFSRSIMFGAPSTQWWTELSAAIAGGLVVATALTLLVTPAMLVLGERRSRR